LIAAVRRIMHPGTKFDTMLTLVSKQGVGKSSIPRALVPDEKWFNDDLSLGATAKEVIEQSLGKGIIELAELVGSNKQAVEDIKNFLSKTTDTARLAYDRVTTERERQFILLGTTNDMKFLNDRTGNRRFLPVVLPDRLVDIAGLIRDRDQLWSEAQRLEAEGASIVLPEELWQEAAEIQEGHRLRDP
jgi:predicted P-loop ATPase